MEQIIGKLSEIETTAETIMRDALQKKKALSAEMERQSKEFDTQLEKQTEEQIKEIRRNLEGEKDKRLSSLREDTQVALSQLDAYYAVSYTHLRAHETGRNLVCRLLLEKKKAQKKKNKT